MPVVPMFHVLSWGMPHACVMVGAKLVLPGPHLDPQSIVDLCEREQVTLAAGVPTVWLGVLQLLERKEREYRLAPGLRIPVGGAAAPEAMIRGFDKYGVTVIHAWGMTETSPVVTVSKLKPHLRSLPEDERYAVRARTGCALPFVDLRVIGDDDREVPADGKAMGEIQVRGPFVTGSYHNKERDPGKFTAGWMASHRRRGHHRRRGIHQDLRPHQGPDQVGRRVDQFSGSGRRHHGTSRSRRGRGRRGPASQVGRAAGRLRGPQAEHGSQRRRDRQFIEPKFAKWWLPDDYIFVDAIPRTSTGKFLKRELREKIARRKLAEAG